MPPPPPVAARQPAPPSAQPCAGQARIDAGWGVRAGVASRRAPGTPGLLREVATYLHGHPGAIWTPKVLLEHVNTYRDIDRRPSVSGGSLRQILSRLRCRGAIEPRGRRGWMFAVAGERGVATLQRILEATGNATAEGRPPSRRRAPPSRHHEYTWATLPVAPEALAKILSAAQRQPDAAPRDKARQCTLRTASFAVSVSTLSGRVSSIQVYDRARWQDDARPLLGAAVVESCVELRLHSCVAAAEKRAEVHARLDLPGPAAPDSYPREGWTVRTPGDGTISQDYSQNPAGDYEQCGPESTVKEMQRAENDVLHPVAVATANQMELRAMVAGLQGQVRAQAAEIAGLRHALEEVARASTNSANGITELASVLRATPSTAPGALWGSAGGVHG